LKALQSCNNISETANCNLSLLVVLQREPQSNDHDPKRLGHQKMFLYLYYHDCETILINSGGLFLDLFTDGKIFDEWDSCIGT